MLEKILLEDLSKLEINPDKKPLKSKELLLLIESEEKLFKKTPKEELSLKVKNN